MAVEIKRQPITADGQIGIAAGGDVSQPQVPTHRVRRHVEDEILPLVRDLVGDGP